MYIWASPRARQRHFVPFNTDQKFITFILLPNSDVLYKSKRGTHGESSSLKPARKVVNYTSLSLPYSLGSGGLLASWRAGSISAHCFPFGFLLGGESSWILGRRKEKIHGSLITTDFSSVSTFPFDTLIFPPFCYYSSWQAFCLQNLLTESVYQSCNRTPGRGTQPMIWVFQLQHLSDFSLNSNLAINMLPLSLMKRYCILNTHFATGHRQELWWDTS